MMKGNNNAFIFQKLQNLFAVSRNIIIVCVWKSPRKLTLFYCMYSKEWMKKSERGKESKYVIISIIFPDIHLCENPGILSGFKATCTCLVKWTDLLTRRSGWLTLSAGLGGSACSLLGTAPDRQAPHLGSRCVPNSCELGLFVQIIEVFSVVIYQVGVLLCVREKLLGWPKSLLSFFCKIRDTLFIFTNNCIDLDILSMLAISCYLLLVGRDQQCC